MVEKQMIKKTETASAKRKAYYEILEQLQQKQIPAAYPAAEAGGHQLGRESLNMRSQLQGLCGYCLLAYDWIQPLADWIGNRACLEIMCGSGALSKALQDCGVNIRATDDFSWDENHAVPWFRDPWTEITQMNAIQAIEAYGKEVDFVVCSWPFLSEDCYHALQKMREVNPTAKMIFIGEWCGATASDAFFAAAQVVEAPDFQEAVRNFKSLYGIRDYPYLLR
jgi:hypothetical protein